MITDAKNTDERQSDDNGREHDGRFAAGNRIAVAHQGAGGNPAMRRARALQYECYRAATPAHVAALMSRLYQLGMAGDVAAAREYLARACGRVRRSADENPQHLPHPSTLVVAFIDQQPAAHANSRQLVEGAVEHDPPDAAA